MITEFMSVACPKCRAGKGMKCLTPYGRDTWRPTKNIHAARRDKAFNKALQNARTVKGGEPSDA